MLSLLFPNTEALRLALASGIIPDEVARQGVAAAPGNPSGFWIRTASPLSKEALSALGRIGVRPVAGPVELPLREFSRWAEALPLKAIEDSHSTDPTLFEVPTARLATFLGELARCGPRPESYCIAGSSSFVRLSSVPLYWSERCRTESGSGIRSYRLAQPNFWVQSGWQHPLPSPDSPRTVLVTLAEGWRTLVLEEWRTARDELHLRAIAGAYYRRADRAVVEIPILLRPQSQSTASESFWVLAGSLASHRTLLESLPPDVVRSLEVAVLRTFEGGECFALSSERPGGEFPVSVALGLGYSRHPKLSRLLIPSDHRVAPSIRAVALERAFGIEPAELAWVESSSLGVSVNRVPLAAFRPLSESIRYSVRSGTSFRGVIARDATFALLGFVAQVEGSAPIAPVPIPIPVSDRSAISPKSSARAKFAKWAGKLFAKSVEPPEGDVSDVIVGDEPASEIPHRTAKTIRERSARRVELEVARFRQEEAIGPEVAAREWAELAELYTGSGNSTDAALCWLNAVWASKRPPEMWLQQWAKLEASPSMSNSRVCRERRLAVVHCIRSALAPPTNDHSEIDLKSAAADLSAIADSLPCRMVWLADIALAKLSGGDVLLLARGRDRLFARLQSETSLAALDTPSFVRFRGLAGRDRFPLAKDWLLRCRDPIQRWLKQHADSSQLAWAGLGADIASSAAYADWMIAWGFAKLGDHTRMNEVSETASRTLTQAADTPLTLAVRRSLQGHFQSKIQRAVGVTTASPAECVGDSLGEYAVAKLFAHSQILGRSKTRSEFGGRPLRALLGDDELGAALNRVLDGTIPVAQVPIAAWLTMAGQDRTAATLPRIVLALSEVVDGPAHVGELLTLVPRALDLLPEAIRLRNIRDSESASYLVRSAGRAVELACRSCVRHGLPEPLRAIVAGMIASIDHADQPTREVLRQSGSRLFRAMNRCGLTVELRQLLGRFSRLGNESPESELSAAIGWYTLGDPERGNRIVNEAREGLFVRGIANERERTRTALAYVRALAHAPPRLALGRLEELFQRLAPIATGGATARFFALKPLELIDSAITAIVNEDFDLGPEVRSWLDADELRIRMRITRDLNAAMNG